MIARRAGVAALSLAAACAPAEISPAGARVDVRAAVGAGCKRVAELRASAGYNGRSGEANEAGVLASLRNDAALKNADAIVIRERTHGAPTVDSLSQSPGATQSGGCPNCVSMRADAYRCPSAAAPSAAVRASAAPSASAAPGSSTPLPVAPGPSSAAASSADDARFSVAADAAIAAVEERARECIAADAPRGEARLRVTFAPTGDVVYAELVGAPFEGTPAGACIAAKARNAHVPAFAGAARTLTKTLRLAP